MTSPIDLLTGGLIGAGGLGLTSSGLLVVSEVDSLGGPEDGTLIPRRVDARLVFDAVSALDGDLAVEAGDLAVENGLGSACILSLFTDARASAEELERFGGEEPRGWWADSLSEFEGDAFGSRLWLLAREAQTAETLARAREYAQAALAWLLEDGIADAVNIEALYPRRSLLGLVVEVIRAREVRARYGFVWEA